MKRIGTLVLSFAFAVSLLPMPIAAHAQTASCYVDEVNFSTPHQVCDGQEPTDLSVSTVADLENAWPETEGKWQAEPVNEAYAGTQPVYAFAFHSDPPLCLRPPFGDFEFAPKQFIGKDSTKGLMAWAGTYRPISPATYGHTITAEPQAQFGCDLTTAASAPAPVVVPAPVVSQPVPPNQPAPDWVRNPIQEIADGAATLPVGAYVLVRLIDWSERSRDSWRIEFDVFRVDPSNAHQEFFSSRGGQARTGWWGYASLQEANRAACNAAQRTLSDVWAKPYPNANKKLKGNPAPDNCPG